MTEKIKIFLPLILPCSREREDHCIDLLRALLLHRRGVQDAHLEKREEGLFLCVHYDPGLFSPLTIEKTIAQAGVRITSRYRHDVLSLEHVDCHSCAGLLEDELLSKKGVLALSLNLPAGRLLVDYDSDLVSRKNIVDVIKKFGYEVEGAGAVMPWFRRHRELMASGVCGILLIAGAIAATFSVSASLLLFILSLASGAYFPLLEAMRAILKGRFDIEFLMIAAALGASALGHWHEGALLLFLFSLGHGLEHYAMDRARSSIKSLASITPREALVRSDGKEEILPVERIQRGDLIVVRPGERIPSDGMVREGHSSVDQSPVTGESLPVEKSSPDQVFAGTLNGEGLLLVEATKLAGESTVSRILQMIEDAQAQKSPLQKLSERFEAVFVPAALVLVVSSMVIPPLLGEPFPVSLYRALALLVAASPCALAIATPSAVLAGIACAAREGVLMKGGEYLEEIGSVKAMAFDKTGTVTEGRPRMVMMKPAPEVSENELLTHAAALEERSGHPLARAFTEEAVKRGLPLPGVTGLSLVPGRGVQGYIGQDLCLVGNGAFMDEKGIELPGWCVESMVDPERKGATTVLAARAGALIGLMAIRDLPRPQARGAFAALRKLGVGKIVLLTGDNEEAAQAVARETGIDEVRAGLLPEDKVKAVDELRQAHGAIAMVGDGINDAPAMAHSTIAVAMGSAGTDVAMETADIALMSDNLAKLPFAVGLGRFTVSVIQQNLAVALGIMAVLVFSVFLGVTGITGAVVFHEGGTLLVVLNALRILKYREKIPVSPHRAG